MKQEIPDNLMTQSDVAIDMINKFINECDDLNFDSLVVQSVLGNAWMRICFGIGVKPLTFCTIASQLAAQYETAYKEMHKDS